MIPRKALPLLMLILCVRFGFAADASNSILTNGDFEGGGGQGNPSNWPIGKEVTIEEEDGNHFLQLQADEPGKQIQAYRKVAVPGGTKALKISFRVRYSDITQGVQNWHTGGVVMHWKDGNGQYLKPEPAPFHFKGDSNGWMEKSVTVEAPDGAAFFEFMPALFQVGTGTLDIDDVVIEPVQG